MFFTEKHFLDAAIKIKTFKYILIHLNISQTKMGVITISLEEESENKLRELAIMKYGKRKGYMSKALVDAISCLSESVKEDTAEERLMKYAETGLHLGKINSKKLREDIYNDRIKGI